MARSRSSQIIFKDIWQKIYEKFTFMRVLVLGMSGMLGSKMWEVLSANSQLEVFGTSRNSLEKFNKRYFDVHGASIYKLLKETKPDFVINCIGVIKPKIIENDFNSISVAIKVNSLFPIELINCAEKLKIKVICKIYKDKSNFIIS